MQNKLIQLINLCLEKNIPFVSFRIPGEPAVKTWLQLYGKFNFVEHFHEVAGQSGFVYAPFHRRTNFPVVFFEPDLIFENENFEDSLIREISEKTFLYPEYDYELPFEITKKEYLKQAETVIHSLNENFSKAVLSRVLLKRKPADFDAGKFFIKLQHIYPNAFCHIINIPGAGVWAGATPETLLRINEYSVQTISLAGTQPFHKGEIIWQEKEIEEQQIVTGYINSILKKFGIRNYKQEEVQSIVAGNAVHLATKFSFDKSNIEKRQGEFISALHPTPAVCGLPKDRALELIINTEKHNREYYSGFCGTINMNEKTDLFINLRCMKILKDKFALFTGGGLTSESNPESEWKETVLKAETLLSVL